MKIVVAEKVAQSALAVFGGNAGTLKAAARFVATRRA